MRLRRSFPPHASVCAQRDKTSSWPTDVIDRRGDRRTEPPSTERPADPPRCRSRLRPATLCLSASSKLARMPAARIQAVPAGLLLRRRTGADQESRSLQEVRPRRRRQGRKRHQRGHSSNLALIEAGRLGFERREQLRAVLDANDPRRRGG
jgi:hypothetical protein